MNTFVCICLVALFGSSFAQVIGIGKCPNPPVQQDFDVAKYMGTWYEIEKFPVFYTDGKCVTAEYKIKDNGNVNVFNTVVVKDGSTTSITGEATIPDPNEPAKLSVKFFALAPGAPYWVVETDYDQYVLVFGCTSVLGVTGQNAYILSRTREIDQEIVTKLENKAQSYGINPKNFVKTNQQGCE